MLPRLLARAALSSLLVLSLVLTAAPASAQTTDVVEGLIDQLDEVEGLAPLDPALGPVSDLVLGLTNQIDDVLSDVPLVNTLALRGEDVVDAGIAFSQATFPDGAGTAILSREDLFADAFASGAFQGRFAAPLLFTEPDDLDPRTGNELVRLGMDAVTILGGEDALDPFVVSRLELAGLEVIRVGGPTRVETAVEAAEVTHPDADHAVLVRAYPDAGQPDSQAYADLLAAGPYAAENGWPILMTTSDALHPAVAEPLEGYDAVTIVGGTGAVGQDVEDALTATGIDVDRVAGDNRFATAVAIAEARGFDNAAAADQLIIAEQGGRDDVWAPGFASTAYGEQNDAPVLLSDGPSIPTETMAFLADGLEANLLDGGPAVICAPFVDLVACQVVGALMTLNLGLVADLVGTLDDIPALGDLIAALGLGGLLEGGLGNVVELLEGAGLGDDQIAGVLGAIAEGDVEQVTGLLEGLADGSGLPLEDLLGGITGDLPLTDVLDDLLGGLGGGDGDGGGDGGVDLGDIVDDLLGGLGGAGLLGT